MKSVLILLLFSGCNLFSNTEHERLATNNNTTSQSNNATRGKTSFSTTQVTTNNRTTPNNNSTSSNQSTSTNQETNTVSLIPFESLIGEGRSTEGLIAQWKFDGNDPNLAEDSSANQPPMNLVAENGITRLSDRNGIVISNGKLISQETVTLYRELTATHAFTIEVWLKSNNIFQKGPTRIVTFSAGSAIRNFTLGQEGDVFVTRLRTDLASSEGLGRLNGRDEARSVKNINLSLQHIVWTYDGNISRLWVDGEKDAEQIIPGGFSNWDPTFNFALGDELIDPRPWKGELYYVAIYNRVLHPREIELHQQLGSTPNPTLEQTKNPRPGAQCKAWPFDLVNKSSFTLFSELGCTEVEGSVHLKRSSRGEIAALSNIKKIEGDLIIEDINEIDLSPLENLAFIGGDLIIRGNDNLDDLSALSALSFLGGSLVIENNPRIRSMTGFSALDRILGNLVLINNTRLSSLTGLSNIITVDGSFTVDRSPSLRVLEMSQLANVQQISISRGGIDTLSFPSLISTDALWLRSTEDLQVLTQIKAKNFYIFGNPGLTRISNLETNQNSDMIISFNENLKNLNGITSDDVGNLTLVANGLEQIDFSELKRVFGTMFIWNSTLTSLNDTFPQLSEISGKLTIVENKALVSVTNAFPLATNINGLSFDNNRLLRKVSDGFPALQVVSDLEINNNRMLPQCDAVMFSTQFIILGSTQLSNNDNLGMCPNN